MANQSDKKLTALLLTDVTEILEVDNLKATSAIKIKLDNTDNQPPHILEVYQGDLN
jgi:hypothetical protein